HRGHTSPHHVGQSHARAQTVVATAQPRRTTRVCRGLRGAQYPHQPRCTPSGIAKNKTSAARRRGLAASVTRRAPDNSADCGHECPTGRRRAYATPSVSAAGHLPAHAGHTRQAAVLLVASYLYPGVLARDMRRPGHQNRDAVARATSPWVRGLSPPTVRPGLDGHTL